MTSMADRFRKWYEYERDCNAKTLDMLESVPQERRSAPEFQKAIDKMAHLVAARRRLVASAGPLPRGSASVPAGNRVSRFVAARCRYRVGLGRLPGSAR